MAQRGRPRKFDKDKTLSVALRLFWEHGYEGTSVALLADAMKLNPPSLYAAYGNKEQLFLSCVEHYQSFIDAIFQQSFKKQSLSEALKAILQAYIELITMRGWPDGCFMVHTALAMAPKHEDLRRKVQFFRQKQKDRIMRGLGHIMLEQASGEPLSDCEPLSDMLILLMDGLAVQAKSGTAKIALQETAQRFLEKIISGHEGQNKRKMA